jgi:hypothetical protein
VKRMSFSSDVMFEISGRGMARGGGGGWAGVEGADEVVVDILVGLGSLSLRSKFSKLWSFREILAFILDFAAPKLRIGIHERETKIQYKRDL